jgi:hypothetical protein
MSEAQRRLQQVAIDRAIHHHREAAAHLAQAHLAEPQGAGSHWNDAGEQGG